MFPSTLGIGQDWFALNKNYGNLINPKKNNLKDFGEFHHRIFLQM
jgi:hypothetical protein